LVIRKILLYFPQPLKNIKHYEFFSILVPALVALPIGFIWYNPKVFGNAWMKTIGKTEQELKDGLPNMVLVFGLIFAFMIALVVTTNVILQIGNNCLDHIWDSLKALVLMIYHWCNFTHLLLIGLAILVVRIITFKNNN